MKVTEESPAGVAAHKVEEDSSAPAYNPGDADQAQGEDNDYGDGDMDMDEGGGFDDDWVQLLN